MARLVMLQCNQHYNQSGRGLHSVRSEKFERIRVASFVNWPGVGRK